MCVITYELEITYRTGGGYGKFYGGHKFKFIRLVMQRWIMCNQYQAEFDGYSTSYYYYYTEFDGYTMEHTVNIL